MAKVNANTMLRNPETGEITVINAGGVVPDWAEGLIGDHLIDGAGDPEPSGDSGPTVAELKAEIAKRNEGRDPEAQIPATGKKADLIAALAADDAAADGTGDPEPSGE